MSPVHHQEPFLVDVFPIPLRVHQGNGNCYFFLRYQKCSLFMEVRVFRLKKSRGSTAWRVVVRQELVPWVCWILNHSFNKHSNTHTCLVLDGMGKWLEVRGTGDRAIRGESGRAALMGIAKGLRGQFRTLYITQVAQQRSPSQ